MKQQTLSIIKPDAVERNLTDNIKEILIKNNLKILKEKKIQITKEEAAEFYKVHQTKPFYDRLCEYLSSGIIVVMILEGENSIKVYIQILLYSVEFQLRYSFHLKYKQRPRALGT